MTQPYHSSTYQRILGGHPQQHLHCPIRLNLRRCLPTGEWIRHHGTHAWCNLCNIMWNTMNKKSGSGIGVQPENLKSKTASHWLLSQPQSEMVILPPGISEGDCLWELARSILYSSLGLGSKLFTTVIKGMHSPVSMATSVATGIISVCHCGYWD